MKRVALLLSCLALAFVLGACQRIEDVVPLAGARPGELPKERLPFRDALPLDYGDLIGVKSIDGAPDWAQAWFVRPDRSIVIVYINARRGNMLEEALVIPRR